MKLALIGGGGVRAPLFVASALRRAERVGLEELCLMDIDAEKLSIFGELCREVARRAESDVRITTTTDPRAALEGARHAVTTIRVGFEQGRVHDERIALKHGVLGQETTGPGGFAMALRSIPAILDYAELLEQVSPGAWLYSFTNPAGLVTQALRDAGFKRTIGICDGANVCQHAVATWLEVDQRRLRAEVLRPQPPLLDAPGAARRRGCAGAAAARPGLPLRHGAQGVRRRAGAAYGHVAERVSVLLLLCRAGRWPASRATRRPAARRSSSSNRKLLDQLRAVDVTRDPAAGLGILHAYQNRRHATYMHYAQPDGPTMSQADAQASAPPPPPTGEEGEGYAGVALGIIEALETGVPLYTALNVANEGAIPCMRPDDVVEVSCMIDRDGVHPLPIGAIPEHQELLMRDGQAL